MDAFTPKIHSPHRMDVAVTHALEQTIEAARTFSNRQWLLGTSGNLSVRVTSNSLPQPQFYITRSGVDKGGLTLEDFVRVEKGGEVIYPEGASGSAETLLHALIYTRYPQANAIYHVHTVSAAVMTMRCSCTDQVIQFSGLEMLKGLGAQTHDTIMRLPVIGNDQNMARLVPIVSAALEDQSPGFALQGHGVYAWGNSPAAARRHTEIWEYLLQVKCKAV